MQNTEVWINIKASNLGRCFFLLGYAGLMGIIISHSQPFINGLIILVALHGGWSWRQAFGNAAPVAFLIENQQLYAQLASGQLEALQSPLLIRSRFVLVFKRTGLFAWPWLLWPDAINATAHHQLRYFLRSWR